MFDSKQATCQLGPWQRKRRLTTCLALQRAPEPQKTRPGNGTPVPAKKRPSAHYERDLSLATSLQGRTLDSTWLVQRSPQGRNRRLSEHVQPEARGALSLAARDIADDLESSPSSQEQSLPTLALASADALWGHGELESDNNAACLPATPLRLR